MKSRFVYPNPKSLSPTIREVIREILHLPRMLSNLVLSEITFFISRLVKLCKFYRSLVSQSNIKVLSDQMEIETFECGAQRPHGVKGILCLCRD